MILFFWIADPWRQNLRQRITATLKKLRLKEHEKRKLKQIVIILTMVWRKLCLISLVCFLFHIDLIFLSLCMSSIKGCLQCTCLSINIFAHFYFLIWFALICIRNAVNSVVVIADRIADHNYHRWVVFPQTRTWTPTISNLLIIFSINWFTFI